MNADRLKPWQHLVVFACVVGAIYSRRPDCLLDPQFYAEDGSVWFANAWNLGWLHPLAMPEGGYLNTLPRLVCGLALLVPLKSVPLLLNWFGIVIQALPVNVLLTGRCSNWGPLWLRAAQALLYVALPNSRELEVAITNAHWHLVLVACFLAFGTPPTNAAWRAFDVVVLILVGLTGPWALVLAPLVIFFWWCRRQSWSLLQAALLFAGALVQTVELLTHLHERPTTSLGATFELFLRLVAGQIYVGALWGQNSFDLRSHILPAVLVFVAGSGVLVYGAVKLRLEMKLFIAFAVVITAAAFQSPRIGGNGPRWHFLAIDKGARYWFFPMLALVWSLLWIAYQERTRGLRAFSFVCLALMLRAIPHDWRYWPYQDANFGRYLREFDEAAPNTAVVIPIYPDRREMVLIKR